MAKMTTAGVFGGMGGKVGNVVFVRLPDGSVSLRERTVPRDPRTPAQTAARRALAEATRLYGELAPEETDAWVAYAQTLRRATPTPSLTRPRRTCDLFVALTAKFLLVNPGASPPRRPPTSAFFGDGVEIAAQAAQGGVRFEASGPNADGIVTELLLQPLASAGRQGSMAAYRSRGFVAFTPGSLAAEVACEPGLYLGAVRFVRRSTGQMSGLAELGRVRVG